jgi:cell wall-associated NlpC family hydrolase
MGYSIGSEQLQPADIIVSTTSANVSAFIRTATLSRVSHARLYIGNGEIIEAVSPQVRQTTLANAINEDILTIAYRHQAMTPALAEGVIRFAQRQIGRYYDYSGGAAAGGVYADVFVCRIIPLACVFAAGGRAGNIISPDATFFCAELVARAFEVNNLPLVNMASYRVNPDDVMTSRVLNYVGNLRGGDD